MVKIFCLCVFFFHLTFSLKIFNQDFFPVSSLVLDAVSRILNYKKEYTFLVTK